MPRDPRSSSDDESPDSYLSSALTTADDISPPPSPLTSTSSSLSDPPDIADYRDINGNRSTSSKLRRNGRMGSHDQSIDVSSPIEVVADCLLLQARKA